MATKLDPAQTCLVFTCRRCGRRAAGPVFMQRTRLCEPCDQELADEALAIWKEREKAIRAAHCCDEDDGVRGGQGRDDDQVRADADVGLWILGALLALSVLGALVAGGVL